MKHIYKAEHKQINTINSLIADNNKLILSLAKEITRGTFKRKVCSSYMGDLEENLGFSSHHKIGKTMRSAPGIKYFKSALNGELILFFTLPENDELYIFVDEEASFDFKFEP